MTSFIRILNDYGKTITNDIRQNLIRTGTNATGKTSQSLKYTVTEQGAKIRLQIIGRPFFMTVETGRKATPQKNPSPSMVKNIQEWMNVRGLQGSAYGLAKAIQLKGTKLNRDGGRKDIVSSVINDSLVNNISKDLLDLFAKDFLNHTVNLFNDSSSSQAGRG